MKEQVSFSFGESLAAYGLCIVKIDEYERLKWLDDKIKEMAQRICSLLEEREQLEAENTNLKRLEENVKKNIKDCKQFLKKAKNKNYWEDELAPCRHLLKTLESLCK